jgi:hypothetical protein
MAVIHEAFVMDIRFRVDDPAVLVDDTEEDDH